MPSTFFHALSKASQTVLSPELVLLQQAEQKNIDIVKTFVTQSASFARLAEELQLFAQLGSATTDETTQLKKLLKNVTNTRLPMAVRDELHHLYTKSLSGGFVRLRCWTQYGATPWLSEIQGDTNLSESLVAAWTAAIELNVQHGASLVEAVTTCHAVIQSQPTAPTACGEFFTRHPDSGENHLLVIKLWPGAPHQTIANETPTHYAVDVRTDLIVQRQTGVSRKLAKRQADTIVFTQQVETAEFADEDELLELARSLHLFKRQYRQQLHGTFEVAQDRLVFTSFEEQANERLPQSQPKQLLTKVYVATGSADALDITAHENCDGIGLLRGEYLFSRLGVHPLKLLRGGRGELVIDRMRQFLSEADHSYPDKRIIYRLQNFTTHELQQFKSGDSLEKAEPNPYLGWRGGLRLMEQPELFEPELVTFSAWLKRRHAPTGLIVPFVRSTAEWRWIVNRWKERHFFEQPEFENWFQITTPENVSNLEGYVLPEVSGITLNVRTVTALMSGIDPDDAQLQASYPPPIELQMAIIEEVSQRVARLRDRAAFAKIKLHVHLEDFNHLLVTSAVKLRYDGIVMHAAALLIGRSAIGEAETALLEQANQHI